MDKFHEQLLRTEKSIIYRVLTTTMYVGVFLAIMALSAITTNLMMIVVVIIFGAIAFFSRMGRDRQYREYEYIFTNGNLQIDVIYNMKKRKTLYDIFIKDVEEYGSTEEVKVGNDIKIDACYPPNCEKDKYILVFNKDGKKAISIAPDDEVIKLIKLYYIRKYR